MKDQNKYRSGYKRTKAGWIPETWCAKKIGDLCVLISGHGFRKQDWSSAGLPIIRIQNLNGKGQFNYYSGRPEESWIVFPGDVLFSWAGVKGVSFGPQIWKGPKGVLNQHIYKVHPLEEVDPIWLFSSLVRITEIIERKAHGFKGSLLHVHKKEITGQQIPFPPIVEQEAIAKILHTWDDVIDKTRKLITAKKNRKNALMQQMLDKNELLKRFGKDKWNYLPLGSLITSVSRPVPKPKKPYTAIGLRSHGKGTFQRVVEEPEKVAMDTLYCIEQDDIVVNITFAWEGAIAIANSADEGGLVSHRFPTYRVKKDADLSFLRQLILTKKFVWDLGLISPGGAGRNRVLSKTDFLKLKVPVPSKAVQKKIGNILSSVDQEIKIIEDKLTALEKQKRGLMQKLLTGEVRVKI